MKTYTLGFLFKNDKIILAKKKRKIGVGKWNGYGGRVEEGEDKIECLTREIMEECGAVISKDKCLELGCIVFDFQNTDKINQKVYIYRIDEYEGELIETEEMGEPKEFALNEIPYHEMMLGDDKFIPFVLEKKTFKGRVIYSEDGEKIVECVVNEILNEKN